MPERWRRPRRIGASAWGRLDIGKPRGDLFLDRLKERLRAAAVLTSRFIEALASQGSRASCCVHDVSDFESRGIPAVFVASSEFEQTAQVQVDTGLAAPQSVGTPPVVAGFGGHSESFRRSDHPSRPSVKI
ncbi:MAG: hypothetical protein NVS2B9_16220 [Myxococcales bacterium]